ncbi:hypothetical protein DV737_g201, partial [Chaetothyriales sp. CBS 132003]
MTVIIRTPQNTPASNAPISSHAQAPNLGGIAEEELDRAAAASIFAKNPALVSMMQAKLGSLVGRTSGYIENLPAPVRRRIDGLKGIQKEHQKLEGEFQEEVLQLEKKYFAKYTPLAMKQHISVSDLITDRDEEALRALTDVRMEYLDRPGFKLIFEFGPNDFFTNKTISKTYLYREENGYGGDFIYDHAEGDKIDWKAGKDLTVRVESKKQRNKNTKQTRVVKKTVPTESFFNFFSPPLPPAEEGEEDEEDIEERLELDYQLGEDIKEKLIPHAIDAHDDSGGGGVHTSAARASLMRGVFCGNFRGVFCGDFCGVICGDFRGVICGVFPGVFPGVFLPGRAMQAFERRDKTML